MQLMQQDNKQLHNTNVNGMGHAMHPNCWLVPVVLRYSRVELTKDASNSIFIKNPIRRIFQNPVTFVSVHSVYLFFFFVSRLFYGPNTSTPRLITTGGTFWKSLFECTLLSEDPAESFLAPPHVARCSLFHTENFAGKIGVKVPPRSTSSGQTEISSLLIIGVWLVAASPFSLFLARESSHKCESNQFPGEEAVMLEAVACFLLVWLETESW